MARRGSKRGAHPLLGRLPIPQMVIAVGLALCLVPIVGTWLQGLRTGQAVSTMTDEASVMSEEELAEHWAQATSWNAYLAGNDEEATVAKEDLWDYEDQLATSSTGAMAWVEIPAAGIEMAIYHGDGDDALAAGAGHVSMTSLPVGGTSAACWIEGHSGLRNASMFDNIRALEEGDVIGIHVLDQVLAYRVSGWEIVDPDDVTSADLAAAEGKDVLVLVTCTTTPDQWNPRGRTGINDKRLLVYAERCEYDPAEFEEQEAEAATGVSTYVNDYTIQAILAAAILLVALVARLVTRGWRRAKDRRRKRHDGTKP